MTSARSRGLSLLDMISLIIFWFTFNNHQVHMGIIDRGIIFKKLICILWLGKLNGCLLWDINVDRWQV